MGIDDWDQRVFSWLWRGQRRLRRTLQRQVQSGEVPLAERVALHDVEHRLALLGSAIAGRAVRVLASSGAPGWRGDALLLPSIFATAPTRADNEHVARLSVAVLATGCRLELTRPGELGSPAIADVLALRLILDALAEDLPATRSQWRALGLRVDQGFARAGTTETRGDRWLRAVASDDDGVDLTSWSIDERNACAFWIAAWRLAVERGVGGFARSCGELDALLMASGGSALCFEHPVFGRLRVAEPNAASESAPPSLPSDALPTGTEHAGKAHEDIRSVELSPRPEADNPLVHSFEKVHTAEEYGGGQKALDGADELDDHLEALEELDIRHVIRTRERTHSLYRVDALLDGHAVDLHDDASARPPDYVYDEWHGKRGAYLRGHCQLYVDGCRAVRPAVASAFVRETIRRRRRELGRLEAQLSRLELQRRATPRRPDGEEVDIDAVVDAATTMRAGQTPSSRLYVRSERHEPGLGICLLLDLSLSSDAYVDDQRVLDVSRDAAFVVGQALDPRRAALAVAGFHSNTRHDCRFVVIKSFGDDWHRVRGRLAGLQPCGYTRVGPALRHARHVLACPSFRRRAVIVVTDGQPTDYDRYEGRHGTADVRQAVREARRDGVDVFALAVSATHRVELGQMFDRDRYALLPHPAKLPDAMSQLLTQLVRRS